MARAGLSQAALSEATFEYNPGKGVDRKTISNVIGYRTRPRNSTARAIWVALKSILEASGDLTPNDGELYWASFRTHALARVAFDRELTSVTGRTSPGLTGSGSPGPTMGLQHRRNLALAFPFSADVTVLPGAVHPNYPGVVHPDNLAATHELWSFFPNAELREDATLEPGARVSDVWVLGSSTSTQEVADLFGFVSAVKSQLVCNSASSLAPALISSRAGAAGPPPRVGRARRSRSSSRAGSSTGRPATRRPARRGSCRRGG